MSQKYLSQLDALCIKYLAAASTNDDASKLTNLAMQAKQRIVSMPQYGADIVSEFDKNAKSIVHITDEGFSIDRKVDAAISAIESSYNVSLTAKQKELVSQLAKSIDIAGSMTDIQADTLYVALFNVKPNDSRKAALIAIVEDAVQHPEYILDESVSTNAMVDYAMTVANEQTGIARVPAILANIKLYRDSSKLVPEVLSGIDKLILQQRTPSALVAAEYIEQLRNNLKDWSAAMKYGAVTGSSYLKPKYTAAAEKRLNTKLKLIDSAKQLIHDICSTKFNCSASFTSTKNSLGEDILKVKLISNFSNADETTYNAVSTILSGCGFKSSAYAINSFVNWLIVVVDLQYYTKVAAMPLLTEADFDKFAIASLDKNLCQLCVKMQLSSAMLTAFKQQHRTEAWYSIVKPLLQITMDANELATLAWYVANEHERRMLLINLCTEQSLRVAYVDELVDVDSFIGLPTNIQEELKMAMCRA